MARIRSIKPEIWVNSQFMSLSHSARLLFIGLITQADDDGRGHADPRYLKAAIFPGDDCKAADVAAWLAECVSQNLVVVYDGGEHGPLYAIPKWNQHQVINRRTASRLPKPNGQFPPNGATDAGTFPNTPEHSTNNHGAITEDSRRTHGALSEDSRGIGSDRKGSLSNLLATSARTRAKPDRTVLKNGSEAGIKPQKVLQRSGIGTRNRNEPRAGPGGLQPLDPVLETFIVEHTPEWAKVPS